MFIFNISQYKFYREVEFENVAHQYPHSFNMLVREIQTTISEEDKIFLDIGYGTLNQALVYMVPFKPGQIVCEATLEHWIGREMEKTDLDKCLDENPDLNTLIALNNDGQQGLTLSKFLRTEKGKDFLEKNNFKEKFRHNGYRIYKRSDNTIN